MKLIRRKRKPTPAQQGIDVVRKVVRGLVAVRMLRTAYGTYKFARRLPLLIGLAGAGAAVAAALRKLRGGSDGPPTETWSPPTPAPSPSPSPSSTPPPAGTGPSASAPETRAGAPVPSPAPELSPNPTETAATGTPPVEPEHEPATPPSVSAASAEDEAVADAPGESSEADTQDGAAKT